ncbi:hypothetical protein AQUCO_01000695v1 [Aquilegia coerulea]|uniref:Uncharacterized protein n=1 Tax=Aquilegia coerulea TaxID=218851 RepID=A0A2G5EB56_AQUCA|nr:hypothetical protein AQUCO_01000695v1 [Aquilegia coerulea]
MKILRKPFSQLRQQRFDKFKCSKFRGFSKKIDLLYLWFYSQLLVMDHHNHGCIHSRYQASHGKAVNQSFTKRF